MDDLIYLAAGVAFFLATVALVRLFERLRGPR